ncbi:DUF3325 domain-containing protein [Gilvimarinus agarilyticus]|uniref:DUF3325 domain-containing protein n=1 Tax=Gilvimarinus agarilyticus TaxID=679259 RepID=UPI0006970452
MTVSGLVLTLCLVGVSAMTCLCLAMKRHAFELANTGGALPLSGKRLRCLGWLLIVSMFVFAVIFQGWSFGLVSALACLTLAAMVVIMTVTYYLPWLARLGVVSAILAAILLMVG